MENYRIIYANDGISRLPEALKIITSEESDNVAHDSMDKRMTLLKLVVTIAILVAVFEPSNKLFKFWPNNSITGQHDPSENPPNLSGMRKMNEELIEMKPVAKHERIRRQINPSNGNGDFFSDGCSKSEYEASIKIKLQNLLLENEKNKTEYIENQLSLRKGKLAKKMNLTFPFYGELKKLKQIFAAKLNNFTYQLESQQKLANQTIDQLNSDKSSQIKLNALNAEFKSLKETIARIVVQIGINNEKIRSMQEEATAAQNSGDTYQKQYSDCCSNLVQYRVY
uniref:Uncharacterized protein n=1 Tax=Daphnia galeata TaxID=27404 RepID=A0A8J2WQY5_9CRUS|nr:unnamed protein product [Daphnia galeata]